MLIGEPLRTITLITADHVAKVAEAATRLEYGMNFQSDIGLQRENRLRSIHSSLAIEGNTLSYDEVKAVLAGKITGEQQQQAEVKEVENAHEAYEQLESFNPYAVEDFLKAHGLLTQGLIAQPGAFRC